MPHADSSLVPGHIQTKTEFWEHVHTQLEGLLEGQRHWISNLSNASSLIFNSLSAFPKYFGNADDRAVNWCGFYIHSILFPSPQLQVSGSVADDSHQLLLGPFCGKPACQFIQTAPGKARGVCADAYIQAKTIVVPEVDLYPGHIACDGETKSEIVCPLILNIEGEARVLGVLDLDCFAPNGFDHEDKIIQSNSSNRDPFATPETLHAVLPDLRAPFVAWFLLAFIICQGYSRIPTRPKNCMFLAGRWGSFL